MNTRDTVCYIYYRLPHRRPESRVPINAPPEYLILILCWWLRTGTMDILLIISTPVAVRYGWTSSPVMVTKQTLRHVHATAGAFTTVITARTSP